MVAFAGEQEVAGFGVSLEGLLPKAEVFRLDVNPENSRDGFSL
ncbi:hypothetical protein EV13_0964 [Prochlorococcus sp. MIT 0702]|nr:hypothetical protein EV12_0414 [Prochlorococcus sp. MIT 0701]KGG29746.1 hypothetical protein EV13_0964 [Prochlorococcus sp. MIT 0702]KGG34302.1 hypothetical protein EV14_1396 [Prochlorococcus sp. MIT 0703]